ncbi:MAG: protecting protein DprA [Actinomycetia bacterium]|nr:protecting protein DprA [Actinomycetes bacterium]
MNGKLTDEAYARAALTYLAEPTDRWLGQLIRVHGAAVTLDAIKTGRPLGATELVGNMAGQRTGSGVPRGKAHEAIKAAMERWRTRLPELPAPEQILAFGESGIRLACPGDPEWPGQLADLGDDQPYALWLRGNADLRFSCLRSVAIVGSRAATAYGSYVASEFAASVAARGVAVVSGGAFGVDAAAHRGALAADGVTIAVLACGVDVPYPTAHAELFDAIAAQGVIVSEWPPGRHVSRLRFLVRNRMIAALATGTLVVEAGQRSGAVNTARYARDLRRRLMAVPGPITSDLSAGCHQVIREWQGTLVTSAAEVIEHVSPVGEPVIGEPSAAEPGTVVQLASRRQAMPVFPRDLLDLESAKVLDAMPRRGGMGTVRVAQRAGLAPATTATLLGKLATGGFVERCDDGWRLRPP